MIDGGLRRIFREHLPDVFQQSIETGGTGKGIPDIYYCAQGVMGWVEMKKTAGNIVGNMEPEQIAWMERHARNGGRGYIAVRRQTIAGPRKGPAVDELHLVGAMGGRYIRSVGLAGLPSNLALGQWGGGPAGWNWSLIRAIILTK